MFLNKDDSVGIDVRKCVVYILQPMSGRQLYSHLKVMWIDQSELNCWTFPLSHKECKESYPLDRMQLNLGWSFSLMTQYHLQCATWQSRNGVVHWSRDLPEDSRTEDYISRLIATLAPKEEVTHEAKNQMTKPEPEFTQLFQGVASDNLYKKPSKLVKLQEIDDELRKLGVTIECLHDHIIYAIPEGKTLLVEGLMALRDKLVAETVDTTFLMTAPSVDL